MSKSESKKIEKNLKLSADFHQYSLKHPDLIDSLPEEAHIVFGKEISSVKGGDVFLAEKRGSRWTLSPVG